MFEIEGNISPLFYLREVRDKTFLLLKKKKNIPGSSCECNICRESCPWVKELGLQQCCRAVILTKFTSARSSEHLTLKTDHLTLKADKHQGKPPCLCCSAGRALQSQFPFVTK